MRLKTLAFHEIRVFKTLTPKAIVQTNSFSLAYRCGCNCPNIYHLITPLRFFSLNFFCRKVNDSKRCCLWNGELNFLTKCITYSKPFPIICTPVWMSHFVTIIKFSYKVHTYASFFPPIATLDTWCQRR